MARVQFQPLPAAEAVRFFRNKGFAVAFDWRDVWQEENVRAFTVAKAMRLDLLRDIRAALDKALTEGTTRRDFINELTPLLQRQGWWGVKRVRDPKTGRFVRAQLGSPRRLKLIFDVNMRTAYAAGAWERAQRTKGRRPFLRYVQLDRPTKREDHRPWHGTVLPIDHPFWKTHYPPNGWNCGCRAIQLSERDLRRFGFRRSERAPPIRRRPFRNRRTGEVIRQPVGIDPGWAYNVGQAHMRGLTPPPSAPTPGGLPPVFTGPPARVALPPPRAAPAGRILPAGLSEREYLRRFLAEFDVAPGARTVFTDAIGEPLVIDESFFLTTSGQSKVKWRNRERHLLLLADTIKDPDEIWWQWEEFPSGRMTLLRRYLARFEVEGRVAPAFVMFDVAREGWRGVTAFGPDRVRYLVNQRGGTLAYRRGR